MLFSEAFLIVFDYLLVSAGTWYLLSADLMR